MPTPQTRVERHLARVEHMRMRRFWLVRLFDVLRGFPRQISDALQRTMP